MIDIIIKDYDFLIKDKSYEILIIKDPYNIMLKSELFNIYFFFLQDWDRYSIQISTTTISTNDRYKEKAYDFFYIVKLLCPDLDFNEIKTDLYLDIIKNKWDDLNFIFKDENLDSTLKEINDIRKKFNKIRWKKK